MTDVAIGIESCTKIPRRLLLIASSSSDLVEMLDMARMLAHRGHSVKLIYACEGRISTLDTEIRTQLDVASGNVGRLEVIALDLRSHDQIKASAG